MTDKTKILILEKDIPAAMRMVHLLTHAGCDVRVAPTARQGIDMTQTTRFDLIVLDLDLPDARSFDVGCNWQQRYMGQTPIVCISGRSSEIARQRSQELGAVDYLVKEFDAQDFVRRILIHSTDATPFTAA